MMTKTAAAKALQQTILKQTIKHWERMATGKARNREKPNAEWCMLCHMYLLNNKSKKDDCKDCPVFTKTKKQRCRGTPYSTAWLAYTDFGINSAIFKTAARKELAFLKSLRDKPI